MPIQPDAIQPDAIQPHIGIKPDAVQPPNNFQPMAAHPGEQIMNELGAAWNSPVIQNPLQTLSQRVLSPAEEVINAGIFRPHPINPITHKFEEDPNKPGYAKPNE